jgi:Ras-related protein Rab-6A
MAAPTNHRVVMVGNTSVGKTAIINQYIYNNTSPDIQPTVGIDFFAKALKVNGRTVRLQLWDTAGQEKFHSLIPSYLRNATVAILVYDITNRDSFDKLDFWHHFTTEQAKPTFFAVGNKIDLEAERRVSTDEGRKWAEDHTSVFFETSAVTPTNIAELFQAIAEVAVGGPQAEQAGGEGQSAVEAAQGVTIDESPAKQGGGGRGCC